MKSRVTETMAVLAVICSGIALVMNMLMFSVMQPTFIRMYTRGSLEHIRVSDGPGSLQTAINFIIALIVFIGVKKATQKSVCWTFCLIGVVARLVMSILSVLVSRWYVVFISQMGTDYLATYSVMQSARAMFESPFLLMALIFMAIALGTAWKEKY